MSTEIKKVNNHRKAAPPQAPKPTGPAVPPGAQTLMARNVVPAEKESVADRLDKALDEVSEPEYPPRVLKFLREAANAGVGGVRSVAPGFWPGVSNAERFSEPASAGGRYGHRVRSPLKRAHNFMGESISPG